LFMNVLLLRWDTKPDKRIRGTFPTPDRRRSTSSYAAIRAPADSKPIVQRDCLAVHDDSSQLAET
jgi:hypothetical protein